MVRTCVEIFYTKKKDKYKKNSDTLLKKNTVVFYLI